MSNWLGLMMGWLEVRGRWPRWTPRSFSNRTQSSWTIYIALVLGVDKIDDKVEISDRRATVAGSPAMSAH